MSGSRVIISGGGTGGHIFPAIAIANALKAADAGTEILFVGALGKMEMEKVPEAGYNIIGLPVRGIQRKLDPANLKVPFLLLKSIWISYKTIRSFKPDVVIGVGGYASSAVVFTASLLGIKTLIQEQNSYPGLTNKILAKMVDTVCVAFEGMDKYFPSKKIKLLGNPIRQDILQNSQNRDKAMDLFKLDKNRFTIIAAGGSLGARTINKCVIQLFPLIENFNLQILWQCGITEYESLKKSMDGSSNPHIHLFMFIREMGLAYACCDLMISRAGAISISEITALGKPAILIPSPYVAEDHQTKNAKALSDKNAAVLLKDNEAEFKIKEIIGSYLGDVQKIKQLQENILHIYSNKNASKDIADEINRLIKKG